jgi:hypothetical protein
MGRLAADAAALGPTYFMPAGLVVLVFGILMVVVLYPVADMALKPTGEQVGLLAAMAAILVLGVGYVIMRTRAIQRRPALRGKRCPPALPCKARTAELA